MRASTARPGRRVFAAPRGALGLLLLLGMLVAGASARAQHFRPHVQPQPPTRIWADVWVVKGAAPPAERAAPTACLEACLAPLRATRIELPEGRVVTLRPLEPSPPHRLRIRVEAWAGSERRSRELVVPLDPAVGGERGTAALPLEPGRHLVLRAWLARSSGPTDGRRRPCP